MVWNQFGNNGQDCDLWGSSKSGGNFEGNGNKGGCEQGLLDLDDIFCKLSKKFGGFGGGKGGVGGGNSVQGFCGLMGGCIVGIVVVVVVIIWVVSGFYIIKEVECGVVICFGKFSYLVESGLNWKLIFIDNVQVVNVELVCEFVVFGVMLIFDENVVCVEMNVQYCVIDLECYLFSVISVDDSLCQVIDSVLCGVIGKYIMDCILIEGCIVICSDIQCELEEMICLYNMGIILLDVNFQMVCLLEEVKVVFDDVIVVCENEQQYICEVEVYINEVQLWVNGQVQCIFEEVCVYKIQIVLEVQGEVVCFVKILLEYKVVLEIICECLYIEIMEKVLSYICKVLVNDSKNGNLMVLLLDQMLKGVVVLVVKSDSSDVSDLLCLLLVFSLSSVSILLILSLIGGSIMD